MDPGVSDQVAPDDGARVRICTSIGEPSRKHRLCLRQAWDGSNLGTMTRRATTPHISVVDISAVELRAELTRTDTANGFANRFLWCASMQSKFTP